MKLRIFNKDNQGRDLFYIDLFDFKELNNIWLSFSMGRNTILTPQTERLIKIIEERLVSHELLEEFIQMLFKEIQSIPDIEQVYLPASVLNNEGKFCQATYNTLEDIYKDYLPANFEPITSSCGYPYDDICGYLYLKSKDENVLQLTEKEFARVASYSERLESTFQYMKKEGATFFNITMKAKEESVEFFWMIIEKKTELIFIVKI